MKIQITVKRGKNIGGVCEPHKHQNGKYVVSKARFEVDYIYVDSYEDIINYLNLGYKVRVSCPVTKSAPSLVNRVSLVITKD